MSIPLPHTSGEKKEYKSKCDLYDGDESTSGICKGWVTATQTCMRRNDEIGKNCDGISPP